MPRPRIDPKARMLRAVSETQWQNDVIGVLESFGWDYYHTHDSRRSVAGFPDLLAIHGPSGDIFVAELKRQTEKPTPAQVRWLALFGVCEIDAYVWRPGDMDAVIERAGRHNK